MRTSKKFLDRPKSMTVIKFNNSPGLDPHQNANFLGKQNVNQF